MKHINLKAVKLILGTSLFLLILGFGGSIEYNEQVIYNMSDTTYEAIVEKLGEDASEKDIVREYTEHKSYYDSNY